MRGSLSLYSTGKKFAAGKSRKKFDARRKTLRPFFFLAAALEIFPVESHPRECLYILTERNYEGFIQFSDVYVRARERESRRSFLCITAFEISLARGFSIRFSPMEKFMYFVEAQCVYQVFNNCNTCFSQRLYTSGKITAYENKTKNPRA